jgi:hypothetical protein
MRNVHAVIYVLLTGLSLFVVKCSQQQASPTPAIVAWLGPDKENITPEAFQRVKNAGFTISYSPHGEKDLNLKALDLAASTSLRLLISDDRIDKWISSHDSAFSVIDTVVADYMDHPALWGYYLAHKVKTKDFSRLAVLKNHIEQKDSTHFVYISIHPNYATPVETGSESYSQYLELFMGTVRPQVLVLENFPITSYFFREDYFANLEQVRSQALRAGIPFWSSVLTVGHAEYPHPEPAHLRLQIFSGLAYGAAGVIYFTYSRPNTKEWDYQDALLDKDGMTTNTYDDVAKLNTIYKSIYNILGNTTSTGVYHTPPVPSGCQPLAAGLPITFVDGEDILIGFFNEGRKNLFALLVNKDYYYGKKISVIMSKKTTAVNEIVLNELQRPLRMRWNDSAGEKIFTLLFKAGEGKLFQIRE